MQRQISGLQIALLMFTVIFLAVPLGGFLQTGNVRAFNADPLFIRVIPFGVFALLILFVNPLRSAVHGMLSASTPKSRRLEVILVALSMIPLAWATSGARTLWVWLIDPSALAGMKVDAVSEFEHALSIQGMVLHLLLGVIIAPFLEEILCRGFLYRAFARDWGWLPALVATSVVFGAYHPFFLNAFVFSIVLVCLLRRTGSLRATIAVHAFSNLVMWWPLMGQYVFPDPALPPDHLSTWARNLICLAIAVVAIPVYIWMSRDRDVVDATVMLEPHGALSK